MTLQGMLKTAYGCFQPIHGNIVRHTICHHNLVIPDIKNVALNITCALDTREVKTILDIECNISCLNSYHKTSRIVVYENNVMLTY